MYHLFIFEYIAKGGVIPLEKVFFKKHRILMHDRHLGSTFDLHVGPPATDCIKEGGVREP